MASNVLNQAEENWGSKELVDVGPIPNGHDDEAETGGGMITAEEEYRAYKELEDALQVPIGNPHEFKGIQTDPCRTDQTNRSNSVQGQPDRSYSSDYSDMVEELLDYPENLESLFYPPAQPQLHQLQPLQEPPIYTTNVLKDDCRKRTYPFEDNDPSLLKKNNISTNDNGTHVSNSASSENQAANVIPKGYSQLGSYFDTFLANEYGYAQTSINGEPRDFSNYNNFIELDDISLAEFSDTDIDGGRAVTNDGNTKGVHESVNDYFPLAFGASAPL